MGIYVKTAADEWTRLGAGKDSGGGGASWGDWTIVDAPNEADTWKAPDSQGRIWKYVEFNAAGDYEINLSGGQYWVLAVGGGDGGYAGGNVNATQGQPGLVREGYWEFGSGTRTVTVGARGVNNNTIWGQPSFIDDVLSGFSTQGESMWGSASGRGIDPAGYVSSITGNSLEYATGWNKTERPGRAGNNGNEQRDGCVIIATVDEEKTDYYPPGALPGVGGWATITGIDGSAGTRYQYGDWVAYEFTADGELTTLNGGLVDAIIQPGGGGYWSPSGIWGSPKHPNVGIEKVDSGKNLVVVGNAGSTSTNAGAINPTVGGDSSVGSVVCHANGAGVQIVNDPFSTFITGSELLLGGLSSANPTPDYGGSATNTIAAQKGVVICRVPKAHAYLGALPAGWVDA